MTSKFASIAKVRKQQMDIVENNLAKARHEKNILKKKIASLLSDIQGAKIPQSGNISLISIFKERQGILRREKEILELEFQAKKEQIIFLLADYKKANLEFEKIKYLQEQDYVAYLEKIKKKERVDMDEISTMLFSNDKGR